MPLTAESVLRSKLTEILLEMDRHHQALKDLEKQKWLIHSQLNAVVDPIARLPLEISSEIFIQCLYSELSFHKGSQAFTGASRLSIKHVPQAFEAWRASGFVRICSALVLPYLTLPALETPLISDLDISRQDFLSFLKRSSPPLRSLSLSSENYEKGEVEEYLRLVPNITDFAIGLGSDRAIIVLELFAYTKTVLPNLRSLTISTDRLLCTEHGTVVDLLDARCASDGLRSFRLVAEEVDIMGPHAIALQNTIKAHTLRGVDIYIGTEEERIFEGELQAPQALLDHEGTT
ncbi:hypothetical protein FB45DRAFT_1039870 [Roridomyces roridus]|uniref:Uncharacterized protein n=1 Tax=Roridomyces roridus TaxID=1738132 RepID=A0AAD7B2Q7_9AGAR|nr:hypothetical protein FB45DRAFT_1039870 [Roridomyces roridus]